MRAPGERVGAFEIVRYLASGGMGDVYVALDTASREEVAIKFLADANRANIERFEREGRIAASLRHPHIIAGRGHGRAADGMPYIALELLKGRDLETYIRERGISATETLAIAMQVCDALDAAHARRIIHRDLKPENIFVCDGSELHAKVLDFGIARFAGERRMTGTGVLVGSWSYMSPEQARGEPDIDERSDLWSLGVVLFECLAGRLPFDAPTGPGTLYQILFDSAPDLAALAPALPRSLVDVVQRCLHKARDRRPARAIDIRMALASVDRAALPSPVVRPIASDAPGGYADTFDADSIERTMSPDEAASLVEIRLTSVVFLRSVQDSVLVGNIARELQGRVVSLLGDGIIVVFGSDRWNGDEPERAVRMALAAQPAARGIGVSTGRVVRGVEQITGAAVDTAAALSRRDGITLDPTTAGVAAVLYTVAIQPDGTGWLDPRRVSRQGTLADPMFATPLVGREGEVAMLAQCVESAASDQQPRGVVVLGAAGMGKSRVRHEAMTRISALGIDMTVLSTRCEAFRQSTPFAALSDALSDVVDASVAKIFTSMAQAGGDPVAALDRARASLETVLRGMSERGAVVLAIDDAQWLDPTSQSAIRWVCENAPDLPLAVWLFSRPESRDALSGVLPGANVVELKTLAKPAAEQLLNLLLGSAPEVVLERAGGHPMFLEELAKLYRTRGANGFTSGGALPPSIESAQLAQFDQLEPGDREFLKRAALFGRTAWLEGVVSLGADGGSLDRLRKTNVLLVRPRSRFENTREFAFRSGVLQEVVEGLWPEVQRAKLHARIAEWMSPLAGAAPEELARHWEIGGENARAAEAYAAAAEAAAPVSDDAVVTSLVDRVIALTDDARLRWRALVARDSAAQLAGDRDVQRKGLEQILLLAPQLGLVEQAEAAWRYCYFARITLDNTGARRAGTRAIEIADEAGDARWGAAAHTELALLLADDGQFDAAEGHAVSAVSLAERAADEWQRAKALAARGYVCVESGRLAEAVDFTEQAAARFARAGDRRREAVALQNAGDVVIRLGRTSQAAEFFDRAIEMSRRVGNHRTLAVATHNRGVVARMDGEIDRAFELQRASLRESEALRFPFLVVSANVELVHLCVMRADRGEASAAAVQSVRTASTLTRGPASLAAAHAAILRGDALIDRATTEDLGDARAVAATLDERQSHARVDLLCAIAGSSGDTADVAAAAEAIRTATASIQDPNDRDVSVDYLVRRYFAPAAVAEAFRT